MTDSFPKYTKIRYPSHKDNEGILDDEHDNVRVEEKIDGANFRFKIHNGQLIFGSKNKELDKTQEDMFGRCVRHIKKVLEDKDLSEYEGWVFYGENCTPHTLEYDWETIPIFLGFDILIPKYGYVKHPKKYFDLLSLDYVPIIEDKITVGQMKRYESEEDFPISYYTPAHKQQRVEGVVIKNLTKMMYAKLVSDDFKEVNKETFGGAPKHAANDTEYVLYKYCTNNRIDNNVFKLLDEGHSLEMPLMKYLPKYVLEDIFEENGREIFFSNMKVDFKELRKRATKRCATVLKQIVNNSR